MTDFHIEIRISNLQYEANRLKNGPLENPSQAQYVAMAIFHIEHAIESLQLSLLNTKEN